GDEMQGLKKGVVELADLIAVNKADGDNIKRAQAAAAEYRAALHILTPRSPNWSPPVLTFSALTGDGVAELWDAVLDHRRRMTETGDCAPRGGEQRGKGLWAFPEDRCSGRLGRARAIRAGPPRLEAAVAAGRMTPAVAVDEIAAAMGL